MALRGCYKDIKIDIYKPFLRAKMEQEIRNVCDGVNNMDDVYLTMKNQMKNY